MARNLLVFCAALFICQVAGAYGEEEKTELQPRQAPFPWFKWFASLLSLFSPGDTQDILNKNWTKSLVPIFGFVGHNIWNQLKGWLPWLLWLSLAIPMPNMPNFRLPKPQGGGSPNLGNAISSIASLGGGNPGSSLGQLSNPIDSLSSGLGPLPVDVLQATGGLPY